MTNYAKKIRLDTNRVINLYGEEEDGKVKIHNCEKLETQGLSKVAVTVALTSIWIEWKKTERNQPFILESSLVASDNSSFRQLIFGQKEMNDTTCLTPSNPIYQRLNLDTDSVPTYDLFKVIDPFTRQTLPFKKIYLQPHFKN